MIEPTPGPNSENHHPCLPPLSEHSPKKLLQLQLPPPQHPDKCPSTRPSGQRPTRDNREKRNAQGKSGSTGESAGELDQKDATIVEKDEAMMTRYGRGKVTSHHGSLARKRSSGFLLLSFTPRPASPPAAL